MSDMNKAYKLAALAVRQRFAEQHPEYLETLAAIEKGDVAVYSGTYDSVEKVLAQLNVPAAINPDSLRASIIFVNCSSSYKSELLNRLRRHVENGSWLVTSDWALHHAIEQMFPDTVRWTKRATPDEVISVEPDLYSLWSEVAVLGADPQWWLEGGSQPIDVLDSERVRVEAASHDLLVRQNAPAVAVTFDWHKGHVFHVISHFWLKRSRMPGSRYSGPCTDFLKAGMKLSDEGIEKVLSEARIKSEDVNFAMIQSAATSTELVAQLCVRAAVEFPRPPGDSFIEWLFGTA